MELRHLRYFIAVAVAENVSRAAGQLHLSQPALSRQVRDLEAELGCALFTRGAKSLRLTPAGRAFLPEARAVLARAEAAVRAAQAVAGGTEGELDIGFALSPTVRLVPPALRAFQAERPHIRVRLHDWSTVEMLAGLRDGRLQLAFLVGCDPALRTGLKFVELTRLALRLAVGPKHPLARRRSVPIGEVARYPLLVFNRKDYPDYQGLLAGLFPLGAPAPRVAEEHDSVAGMLTAVEAGGGVAVLPESVACVAGPRVRLKPLTPEPAPLVVGAAWREEDFPPMARHFLECARATAAAEGERELKIPG